MTEASHPPTATTREGAGRIFVGIGGWTYEPWRGVFYPPDLPHARELGHASRQLTSIEINATFYRTQTPKSFRRWADETPETFVFSVKGPRYATNRPRLSEAGPSIERFFGSGVLELGDKLGPVLWQLPPNKRLDEDDLLAFLELLPRTIEGRAIRHALEVRHASFRAPQLIDLLSRFVVALVFADSKKYPCLPDLTGDFVYARLQDAEESEPAGYSSAALDRWAAYVREWTKGGEPEDLPKVKPHVTPTPRPRDCFIYFIDGAKIRAPTAAVALIDKLAR